MITLNLSKPRVKPDIEKLEAQFILLTKKVEKMVNKGNGASR